MVVGFFEGAGKGQAPSREACIMAKDKAERALLLPSVCLLRNIVWRWAFIVWFLSKKE